MPTYRAVLVGTVTDRWTKKGQEAEMALLSETLTLEAEENERLHSLQPIPVFGGLTGNRRVLSF